MKETIYNDRDVETAAKEFTELHSAKLDLLAQSRQIKGLMEQSFIVGVLWKEKQMLKI